LTLVALQLLRAGARVEAVLDTAPLAAQVAGGVGMALARPMVTARGAMMRAGIRRVYHAGVRLTEIETDGSGPTGIRWQDRAGRARHSSCDAVALGWHLRAETNLADLAGVTLHWDARFHQWLPQTDAYGRAADGVYLAGDGLRILGADGAELAGKLAATACLHDLGRPAPEAAGDLRQLRRMERFATAMQRAFPWPAEMLRNLPDETILCRCEGIRAGELRAVLPLAGADANRGKALSRVGMGRCQGRYCQLAGAEVLAAQAGVSPAKIGRLRSQPPVRPSPIGALLTDAPPGDAE
jgi:hypothetical protein